MDKPEVRQLTECCICFDIERNILLPAINSEKLLKNCQNYLDSSILLHSFENGTSLSCCSYCYESAHQLTLLEEQVEKLQKEISGLSAIFSKSVLVRRDQFKNEKNDTSNSPTIHQNGHSIVLTEDARKMVCTNLPKDVEYNHGTKESDDRVPNLWFDTDEHEKVISDTLFSLNPSCDDIDVKYSYDEAVCTVPDTSTTEIEPKQQATQNTPGNPQTLTTSMADLLKILKVPVIQLKRLKTSSEINSSNIDECHKKKGKGLMKMSYLQERQESRNKKGPHNCTFCDKSFPQPGLLKKHEMFHTGEKPFSCTLCPKSFITATILRKHTKVHLGKKPYKCASCDKCFVDACGLKQHEKSHSEDRPYKCSICPASYKRGKDLKYHKTSHAGEKPYKCSFCAKSFTRLGRTKEHERTHSDYGDRSYKCSQCEKSYTQKTHLTLHVKNVHSSLAKLFNCSLCSKSFYTRSKLKRHELIHTGERPYKCSTCEITFTQKHYLTYHEHTHKKITEKFILP